MAGSLSFLPCQHPISSGRTAWGSLNSGPVYLCVAPGRRKSPSEKQTIKSAVKRGRDRLCKDTGKEPELGPGLLPPALFFFLRRKREKALEQQLGSLSGWGRGRDSNGVMEAVGLDPNWLCNRTRTLVFPEGVL